MPRSAQDRTARATIAFLGVCPVPHHRQDVHGARPPVSFIHGEIGKTTSVPSRVVKGLFNRIQKCKALHFSFCHHSPPCECK